MDPPLALSLQRPGTPEGPAGGTRSGSTPPATPIEEKLDALARMDRRQAEGLGLYPMRPTGAPGTMTRQEAHAAEDFLAEMRRMDPDGRMRANGEFIRAYAPGIKPGEAVPTGPMRYFPGYSSVLPERELPRETFLTIHSHPDNPLAEDYPSRGDHLGANREGKRHPQYSEMMYDPKSGNFLKFDGRAYPPTFVRADFPAESPTSGE